MSRTNLLWIIGIIFLFSACSPWRNLVSERIFSWNYDDLRLLELDEAKSCVGDNEQDVNDIIALYTRMNVSDLEIRLDFLELGSQADYDLYLALDLVPGGTDELPFNSKADLMWDVLVIDPAEGLPFAINSEQHIGGSGERLNIVPRVFRDPSRDILIFSLNTHLLPKITGGYRTQTFLVSEGNVDGETVILEEIGPVKSDVLPPAQAPMILAFWNTFPAHTPAQSLRRWSGAHTGPLGERHGLKYLLNAVTRYHIPIVLLDIKNSTSLSALDYMGKIKDIQEKSDSGLLILPDPLPDPLLADKIPSWAALEMLEITQEVTTNFNLQWGHFLYTSWLPDLTIFPEKVIFIRRNVPFNRDIGPVEIYRWKDHLVVPLLIPEGTEPVQIPSRQVSVEGPSQEIRCAALKTALAQERGNPQSILVLGGNLPRSAWGDPNVAETVLAYIAAHPWMKPLDAMDIITLHSSRSWWESGSGVMKNDIDLSIENDRLEDRILERLNQAPDGMIKDLAWQAYLDLISPAAYQRTQLKELRENYLGQIGTLLAAAKWEAKPESVSDCSVDTDLDGQTECVLASSTIFTIFETDGARLLFAFARTPTGIQQIVAPSSQFAVGLSDYTTWDLSRGALADPAVIPGAFAGPWESYQVNLQGNQLIFESDSVRKIFSIRDSEISIKSLSGNPIEIKIPLAVSPNIRFQPNWGRDYFNLSSDQTFVWGIRNGLKVLISASEEISSQIFTSSSAELGYSEDPNRDYPPGHFLPYPLAVVSIMGEREVEVIIKVVP